MENSAAEASISAFEAYAEGRRGVDSIFDSVASGSDSSLTLASDLNLFRGLYLVTRAFLGLIATVEPIMMLCMIMRISDQEVDLDREKCVEEEDPE